MTGAATCSGAGPAVAGPAPSSPAAREGSRSRGTSDALSAGVPSSQTSATDRRRPVVVITGASAGVGRATSRRFARDGARIGLIARGRDGLEGAARDVRREGGEALVAPADVADADQVEAAAQAVEERFGPIDVWINNAMVS